MLVVTGKKSLNMAEHFMFIIILTSNLNHNLFYLKKNV